MAADKEPTVAETVTKLKAIANDWTSKFGGKLNYNPHLSVSQLIKPLVDTLSAKDAKLTPEITAKIAALPKDCPVIDPNWKPAPKVPSLPTATAASVGALNAKGE